MVTSDFNLAWAQIDPNRYLSLRRVQNLLINSKNSTSVVVILDCCFAGHIFNNPPDLQLLEAFRQIVKGVQGEKNQLQQSNPCKAIIASTGASALEEALANALIHREYVTEAGTSRAEEVVVEILSDRIEIRSPGGPPPHVSLASLQNAQDRHPGSHPRNPQIMRIFYLKGHAEHVGTGIERMQRFIQEAGLQKPKFDFDPNTQTLIVTLFRRAQPPVIADREATSVLVLPPDPSQSGGSNILPVAVISARRSPVLQGQRLSLTWLSLILITGILIGSVGTNAIPYVIRLGLAKLPSTLPPPSKTIEIASVFPTSNDVQTLGGQGLNNGVQMAVDDTNNNQLLPGYTLELAPLLKDAGSTNSPNPQAGASYIKGAITDNLVAGIIGPQDVSSALVELPITNQALIAQISSTISYPCLTMSVTVDPDCAGNSTIQAQMRPTGLLTFFRLVTTDDRQGKAAADYFFQTQHYRKVLLLNDKSDEYYLSLAQPFQREWQQRGGQILPLDLPEQETSVSDYQKALQPPNVASFKPDLIYFANHNPNSSNVLQALSTISTLKKVAFAGADGIIDNDFRQAGIDRMTPIYASLPIQDPAHSGTSEGADFKLNYIANGHYTNYSPFVASAYDCTMMLVQAIKLALQQVSTPHGPQDHDGAVQFRKAVLQALAHLSYTGGATGNHSFDANGDTSNHTISFYQLDLSYTQPGGWTWLQQVST